MDGAESSARKILSSLRSIGRIHNPESYDPSVFLSLLDHQSRDVRREAVKQLGKFRGESIRKALTALYVSDRSTEVKRECVSSLGRQRSEELIPFFRRVITSPDPKIVIQAIQALLVFRADDSVLNELAPLDSHPNEMVRDYIAIELHGRQRGNDPDHAAVDGRLQDVVVEGDVRDILVHIRASAFHLVFTSPPYYNARDYSLYPSYRAYLEFLRDVFREVHRLTKDGRFLVVNSSPIILPRPNRQHASRRYPIPFDIHHFLVKDGWDFIDDLVWRKPDFSVKNRVGGFLQHRKPLGYKPNTVTEYLMVYRRKSPRLPDWNMRQYDDEVLNASKVTGAFESTNVWEIDPVSDKTHSAVFPPALCERVIRYYSMLGDLVFDPFGGSGTVAAVAHSLGRRFFLTELSAEYVARIRARVPVHTRFLSVSDINASMR